MIKVYNTKTGITISIDTPLGTGFEGGGYTLKDLKEKIGDYRGNITIQINSPGGDPIEAFGIYDYLQALNAESITAVIFGQASSAATIIACAADKVIASPNSKWLMHRVTSNPSGDSDHILSAYKMMQALDTQIAEMYSKKSGKHTTEEMLAIMQEDTFKSANEALELGLINEITTLKSVNKMSNQKFMNLTEEEKEEMDALKAENDKLKEELQNIKAKMQNMEEEEEEKVANAAVDEEIDKGKFDNSKRAGLVAIARKDLGTFKAMAAAIVLQLKKPVEPTKVEPIQNSGMTKEKWLENFKANKYVDKLDVCRSDYRLAYGKELN